MKPWVWPLTPSSSYTPRTPLRSFWRPGYARTDTNPGGFHFATDLGCPNGTWVRAPLTGKAIIVDRNGNGDEGKHMVLQVGVFRIAFLHLSAINNSLHVGDTVRQYSRFAKTGTTGNTQGGHLHLEIAHTRANHSYWRARDPRIDPYPFLIAALRRLRDA